MACNVQLLSLLFFSLHMTPYYCVCHFHWVTSLTSRYIFIFFKFPLMLTIFITYNVRFFSIFVYSLSLMCREILLKNICENSSESSSGEFQLFFYYRNNETKSKHCILWHFQLNYRNFDTPSRYCSNATINFKINIMTCHVYQTKIFILFLCFNYTIVKSNLSPLCKHGYKNFVLLTH